MEVRDLIDKHSLIYHMAEAGTWPSIKKYGLLSTSALLDLYEYSGERRANIESSLRSQSVEICNEKYGRAVIRDQGPLKESLLEKCLQDDMKPIDWYRVLNSMTFFWTTKARLDTLLGARMYRTRVHTVMTVDTATLVDSYIDQIRLSAINSGATVYSPTPRGKFTFKTIYDFPNDKDPVELAILYAVKDVSRFVIKVEERQFGKPPNVIFER